MATLWGRSSGFTGSRKMDSMFGGRASRMDFDAVEGDPSEGIRHVT